MYDGKVMRHVPPYALYLASLLCLGECGTKSGSPGACTTQAGSGVDTYQIFGKWKKISGYATPKTNADLALNYDILVIQPGSSTGVSRLCSVPVSNGSPQSSATYKASYDNDVNAKKITMTFDTTGASAPDPVATYSFVGSCGDTRMNLSYANGENESYQIINQEVTTSICDP